MLEMIKTEKTHAHTAFVDTPFFQQLQHQEFLNISPQPSVQSGLLLKPHRVGWEACISRAFQECSGGSQPLPPDGGHR